MIRTETTRVDRFGPPVFEIELATGSLRAGTHRVLGRWLAVGGKVTAWEEGDDGPGGVNYVAWGDTPREAVRNLAQDCEDYHRDLAKKEQPVA